MNIFASSSSSCFAFSSVIACSNKLHNHSTLQFNGLVQKPNFIIKCEAKGSSSDESKSRESKLEIGSPVIVIEAPKMIKTAATVPCLRVNSGLIKPGDVGRIVSRKPKDLWAVRLSIGTYLIDGKYFKPLDLEMEK